MLIISCINFPAKFEGFLLGVLFGIKQEAHVHTTIGQHLNCSLKFTGHWIMCLTWITEWHTEWQSTHCRISRRHSYCPRLIQNHFFHFLAWNHCVVFVLGSYSPVPRIRKQMEKFPWNFASNCEKSSQSHSTLGHVTPFPTGLAKGPSEVWK